MNDRFKELLKEAGFTNFGPDIEQKIGVLCELIVRECALHLHKRGVEGFGILEERNLKEHFGVE